jgi:RNA polymerase sigma-70 factor (ECF subfamily)
VHIPPEVDRADDAIVLQSAVAKLPDRQRQAVVLYYLVDLSVEDTAAAMRASVGMVKNALFRARRNLAAALGNDDGGFQ